jgi:hypothetical protein
VEGKELLSEVEYDLSGLRLIRHTFGNDEKISQASKVRARLRQRLLEEQASMERREQ